MAKNLESGNGLIDKYQRFNRRTRNLAIGVGVGALGAATMGIGAAAVLVGPSFAWAVGDQLQIMAVDTVRSKSKEAKGKMFPRSGTVFSAKK
jgi:hypothetical protein